ncbi:MAG: cold-shock protein [Rhodospirillales bacterium]|mgnify:FL=1|jgi:CspA family cold shock protein|nr:cold-shock protein [Rhodospirillales bacterium]MBC93012.1 cold-shock protein [Rhodospirillaceae bacterium]|tara:strand:+ start:2382 stop:2585 length:204 start_codon:yes stop_codon:yes gene_type:complete
MTTGTVKFFNVTRGFGFISPEDGSKDVFVHISAVEQAGMSQLTEGQKVNFEVQPDARGPKAVNIQEA